MLQDQGDSSRLQTEWAMNVLTELVKFAATDMEGVDVRLFPVMLVEFIMSESFGYSGAALFNRRRTGPDGAWTELARRGRLGLSEIAPGDPPPEGRADGVELYVPFQLVDDSYLIVVAKPDPHDRFGEHERTFFRLLALVATSALKIQHLSFFDNIEDMLYTHDLEGRFLTVNRAGFQLLGFHPDKILGRSIRDFISPELPGELLERYLRDVRERGSAQGVMRLRSSEGVEHYMSYSNRLVEEANRPPYVRGWARNITERILAKRKLRQMESWVRQVQKMETVGTLAGGVAHDFNNILSGIIGNLALALRKLPADSPAVRHLKTAGDAAQRAADITRKLLTFGRKSKPMKMPLDLGEVVDDTFRLLSETIDRRISVRNDLPERLWKIHADKSQMHQLIMNLCLNARDALLEKRARRRREADLPDDDYSITVSAENITLQENDMRNNPHARTGDYVRIRLADTGCGMDKETMERIYEPFFTTKQLNHGTGLGLSTVYGVVQQHDGWISVSSRPMRGTTFEIFLPACPDEAAPGQTPGLPAAQASHTGGETILFADDEPFIREYCRETLAEAGYNVILACDGKEALALYTRHKAGIDLVILDLTMPHLSGREVMEVILADRPAARIVISSGYDAERIDGPEPAAGHRGILPKPYNTEELLATVRMALE